jgi:ABC-type ATPase with predicted acetyltransferase domain
MTPSWRSARARAIFGLPETEASSATSSPGTHALDQLLGLGAGQVAYITGPSGSGKSTLLRALRQALTRLGARVIDVGEAPRSPQATIDLLPGPVGRALRSLALAGLAEAPLALRAANELSEGERARLALAQALHAAKPGTWVLGDELARGLDAWTSASIAMGLAPWAARARVRLVLAGSREELACAIRPALLVLAGARPAWTWLENTP